MLTHEQCQDLLTDDAFGLLDDAERQALREHLQGHVASADLHSKIAHQAKLIATAAKLPFPAVTFAPPVETPMPRKVQDQPRRRSAVGTMSRWVIAAGVFLTVVSFGGGAVKDLLATAFFLPEIHEELAKAKKYEQNKTAVDAKIEQARIAASAEIEAQEKKQESLLQEWANAGETLKQELAARPFRLEVDGPGALVAGAPNEFLIRAIDTTGNSTKIAINASVVSARGEVVYSQKVPAEFNPRLRLPTSVWATAALSDGTPSLRVTATAQGEGQATALEQTVTLELPAHVTHLATDKPIYRPGDIIYFRTLTLNRQTFQPLSRDLNLRFVIEGPDGREIPSLEFTGMALLTDETGRYILGPDREPIRGVACGQLSLPATLPGGEYLLRVYEQSNDPRSASTVPVPLATSKVLVNQYTPDRYVKTLDFDGSSYGVGEVVQCVLTVKAANKPLANAQVKATATATVKGKVVPLTLDAASATVTDSEGKARFRVMLPKEDITQASISVTTTRQGIVESIVRPVPLSTNKLNIEFFPESGDLIAGVPTSIYLRARSITNKPADVKGSIVDASGKVIVPNVSTLTDAEQPGANQGLGKFTFTAKANEDYFLVLDRPSNAQLPDQVPTTKLTAKKLPAAKNGGVSVALPRGVVATGESLPVQVTTKSASRNLVLGVYLRGQVLATVPVTTVDGKPSMLNVDLGTSPRGGVLRVTVFEVTDGNDWKPVAERLAFRRTSEKLNIKLGQPDEAITPGALVRIPVQTTDESDNAKPAIMYAAVVNQSSIAMADDKTLRTLPTHFLLGGEVQNPDDLERADFFLSDAPKAAEALDLLLGTQGWRRFAEQAPDTFRKNQPSSEAEALLTTLGVRLATPLPWKLEARKLYESYATKFDAASGRLDYLQDEYKAGMYATPFYDEQSQVETNLGNARTKMKQQGEAYWFFEESISQRESYVIVLLPLLVLVGIALIVARCTVARHLPERASFTWGAVLLLLTAALVGGTVLYTLALGKEWQQQIPKPERYNTYRTGGSSGTTIAFPNQPLVNPTVTDWDNLDVRAVSLLGNIETSPAPLLPRNDRAIKARLDARPNPNRLPVSRVIWRPESVTIGFDSDHETKTPAPFHMLEALERISTNKGEVSASWRNLWRETVSEKPCVVREYGYAADISLGGGGTVGMAGATAPPTIDQLDTLLWKPVLLSDGEGTTQLNLMLPNGNATYEVLVAGHTTDGRLGVSTQTITVSKPLSLDMKLPLEISATDEIQAPILVTNTTDNPVDGEYSVELSNLLSRDLEAGVLSNTFDPKSTLRVPFQALPIDPSGTSTGTVIVKLKTVDGQMETLRRNVNIVRNGYLVHGGTQAGHERGTTTLSFNVPTDLMPGSLEAKLVVYPTTLAEFQSSLQSLLREPAGCFEQVSATNYPNVLILDYLRKTGALKPETSLAARDFLERGIAKLTSFECPVGTTADKLGFEWFGAADRPHVALSAYGLLQFTEMDRVSKVDPALIARTKKFLMDRRTGKGGYQHGSEARSFGAAPTETLDAYVTWAITESDRIAGTKTDLKIELETLTKVTQPGYRLVLAASALHNAGMMDEAAQLIAKLEASQKSDGRIIAGGPTIVGALDVNADIETTALAGLVFQRAGKAIAANDALRWLLTQRAPTGGFGTTQSTIQVLKFLSERATTEIKQSAAMTINYTVGGQAFAKIIDNSQSGPIEIALPKARITSGENTITITGSLAASSPVAVTWSGYAPKPDDKPSQLKLTTKMDAVTYTEGTTAKLTVTVKNTGAACGMTTTIIGLPAGMKLPVDLKQLRTLTEVPPNGAEPVVSYFEVRGRELILYRRGMSMNETTTAIIDLVADVPGIYTGPASRAYLYYETGKKDWQPPLKVTITEATPKAAEVAE